jgi:hypothetical protein
LKILLKYHLETSSTPHFCWDEKFGQRAVSTLFLHKDLKFLTDTSVAFAKWAAYVEIHKQHPLNLSVFFETLKSIVEENAKNESGINENMETNEHSWILPITILLPDYRRQSRQNITKLKTEDKLVVKMFWDATEVLIKSFSDFIGKLHEEIDFENEKIEILKKIIRLVNQIKKIETSEINVQLLFEKSIEQSISNETFKYFNKIVNKESLKSKNIETRVSELIRVVELAQADHTSLTYKYGYLVQR